VSDVVICSLMMVRKRGNLHANFLLVVRCC